MPSKEKRSEKRADVCPEEFEKLIRTMASEGFAVGAVADRILVKTRAIEAFARSKGIVFQSGGYRAPSNPTGPIAAPMLSEDHRKLLLEMSARNTVKVKPDQRRMSLHKDYGADIGQLPGHRTV